MPCIRSCFNIGRDSRKCSSEIKMNLKLWFLCLVVLICTKSSTQDNSIESVLEFLRDKNNNYWLGDEKNVVLLIGNTGVGKSTLATILTDSTNLKSVGSVKTGKFIYTDNNRISKSTSTTVSMTSVPELMRDPSTNIAYYDIPGFGDTRGLYHELTLTYYIRKIFEETDSVKLIYVTDQFSVEEGGDRKNFLKLAKHATDIIKNMDKYNSSIGLIVTKVVSNAVKQEDNTYKMPDDEMIIQSIAKFLDDAKNGLNSTRILEKTFIEILLEKKGDKYSKIGLLRNPDMPGMVNDIPLIKNVTTNLKALVKSINYGALNLNDIGFTLSPESIVQIHEKYDTLDDNLKNDIGNINDEIEQAFKQEEKQLSDIFALKEISSAFGKLSEIIPSISQDFFNQIVATLNKLGVSVESDHLSNIARNIEYAKILSTAIESTMKLMNVPRLNLTYITDSFKWYNFLIDLYKSMSDYDVQSKNIDISNILSQCAITENTSKNISAMDLEAFLKSVNNEKYKDIEHLQVNSFKLQRLQELLEQTTTTHLLPTCKSSVLTVTGKFIKTSDILKMNCWTNANSIRLFATDTLFIDADLEKYGQKAQITFIAPTWRVIGERTINLNGQNMQQTELIPALNGRVGRKHGEDGEHGSNGGSAGHFFGIGNRFLGLSGTNSLNIYANGGNGGNGQNGGNGADGVNADKLADIRNTNGDGDFQKSLDEMKNEWKTKGIDEYNVYETEESEWRYHVHRCTVNVSVGSIEPGKGGNGGNGGRGGNAGNILIVDLPQTGHFSNISNSPGIDIFKVKILCCNQFMQNLSSLLGGAGIGGSGGIGGKESIKKKQIIFKHTETMLSMDFSILTTNSVYDIEIESDWKTFEMYPTGQNGKDGAENPTLAAVVGLENRGLIIAAYKHFAFKQLVGNVVESELRHFFDQLNEDHRIRSLYDPLSFIEEFIGFENHYIQLRNSIQFLPFLNSIIERIKEMNSTKAISSETKQLFHYLCSSVYIKICTIENNAYRKVVVNLPEYLKQIEKNVIELKKINNRVAISNYQNEYNQMVDRKVESARHIIETEILPGIESIFDETNAQIDLLIDENIAMQSDKKVDVEQKRKEQEELKTKLALRKLLMPLRIFGSVLAFAGPKGAMASSVIEGVGALANSLYIDQTSAYSPSLKNLSPTFKKSVERISDEYKAKKELFQVQLNKIEIITNKYTQEMPDYKDLKEMNAKIKEYKSKIKDSSGKSVHLVDMYRSQLQFYVKTKEDILKSHKPEKVENLRKLESAYKQISNVVSIAEITVDQFNRIKHDEKLIATVASQISTMEEDLKILRKHQTMIDNQLVLSLKILKNNVTSLDIDAISAMEMSLTNWKMQSAIRDTKLLFRKLTDGFSMKDDMEVSIDKIENGLAYLAEIFDLMEFYDNIKHLANHMTNIELGETVFENPEWNQAVNKLEKITKSNIALEQFEVAIHAFKQHYFPFAGYYLNTHKFALPMNLSMYDIDAITNEATKQIGNLINKASFSESQIQTYHEYIYDNQNTTFYTWKSNTIMPELRKLLQGENIVLSANIVKGLNFDAIKFKSIGLDFVLLDQTKQSAFDNALKDFSLHMNMIGDNYYRCGSRFYTISTNDNIVISYSFKKDFDGKPSEPNKVYKKIAQNEFFLSPYTLWNITLTNAQSGFDELKKFATDDFDVHLVGYGQYLKSFPVQHCNTLNVERYYNVDKTTLIN